MVGTLHVKTVAAVVDNKKNKTLDDMKASLVKVVNPKITDPKYKLDEEGAGYILETAIWKLGRLNVPAMKAKISELVKEVISYLKDLKKIDDVVIRRLEEMKKFATPRGTQLRVKAANVRTSVVPEFVVVKSNGHTTKLGAQIPSGTNRSIDFAVKVSDRAVVVSPQGTFHEFSLAYATEEKFKGCVGVAKDTDEFARWAQRSRDRRRKGRRGSERPIATAAASSRSRC
jgi:DNA gyrase/topoisomerase IV subunit A